MPFYFRTSNKNGPYRAGRRYYTGDYPEGFLRDGKE
jgi:hypothetical protein